MQQAVQHTPAAPTADLEAVKTRQQAAWSAGDYAVIGTTLADRRRVCCARRSICAPASACSTSRPATATPPSPRRAASPT